MRVNTRILTILCLALFCITLCGQNAVVVSEPVLSFEKDKVRIDYKLLNTSKSEKFSIRVLITKQNGIPIDARSLSGDLGESISGAGNKRIIWDIVADSIFLDEDIFVEVYALPEAPPVLEISKEETSKEEIAKEEKVTEEEVAKQKVTEEKAKEEELAEEMGTEEKALVEKAAEKSSSGKELNRMSLIAQSIVFPGLGLSRLNPGAPHWVRGVAAYGCLAGSVYYNRKAWSSYQDYLGSESPADVDDLFNKAYNEKKTSGILGYAAIGIWVIDLAWTILGTSEMTRDQLSINQKRLSIGSSVEPVSNVPLIALRYKF